MSKEKVIGKHEIQYEAEVDLVAHKHWVAVYQDTKNRQNIRIISGEDAWKFDIQVKQCVLVCSRPYNKCKLIKSVSRPL